MTTVPESDVGFSSLSADAPHYGDTVWFATTVSGSLSKRSQLWVKMVCIQDGHAVYNGVVAAIAGDETYGFMLEDPTGQGLDWRSDQSAACTASLIYAVKKGKNVTYDTLDWTGLFEVLPAAI